MSRPVTLFTIQWGDLPLEEMCRQAHEMGYEGLELSASHLDMKRAAKEQAYVEEVKALLKKYDLDVLGVIPFDENLKNNSIGRDSLPVQDAIKQFYFRLNLPQAREQV